MNFKQICRSLMCLLLVCCLLFNAFPQKVDATSVGAAVITGAASVAVPALNVVGATLIALGLYVGVNGTDSIEAVAQSAVSHLESAGTYIKDGCVELLQTVNSAGEKAYYVAGDLLETLRGWLFYTDVVTYHSLDSNALSLFQDCYYEHISSKPYTISRTYIYDSYAAFGDPKPLPAAHEEPAQEKNSDAASISAPDPASLLSDPVPDPEVKEAEIVDLPKKKRFPLPRFQLPKLRKHKQEPKPRKQRKSPRWLSGAFYRPYNGRTLVSNNGKFLRPGGRNETGWRYQNGQLS